MSISGSCLCGGVRYEVSSPLTQCRSLSLHNVSPAISAAFCTAAGVDPDCFHWLAGQELVSQFQSSPEVCRIFCKICGSNLGIMQNGKVSMVSLGTVSGDPGVRPVDHIFVGSKAPWYEITDQLSQYQEWAPSD